MCGFWYGDHGFVTRLLAFEAMCHLRRALALCAIAVLSCAVTFAQRARFDVLITNGRIVDGTGAPWFRGDVGVTGDRITAIGRLADAEAQTKIDATNLVV